MLKFLRELGGGFTSSSAIPQHKAITNTNSDVQASDMVKKNKQTFKVNRKDVVQELQNLTTKYPYTRPIFLGLRSQEELTITLNHADRLITLPKRSGLPKSAGYAECTNAGKSLFNEDQAMAVELCLGLSPEEARVSDTPETGRLSVSKKFDKMSMFGIFDGHAGGDVAVTVSQELPHRIKTRISDVIHEIMRAYTDHIQEDLSPQTINASLPSGMLKRRPTVDRLITGAMEAAFRDMDSNLVDDELQYTVKGGCATVVAMFYADKLYVANAGDCRAVMSLAGEAVLMSNDFTPESERRRIQTIAERNPDLLGEEFCPRQFTHRLGRKDIGTQTLYRDSRMEGWALKTVTEEDLRFPMIMGDGRRSRLLATIGLTRGLGDHSLKVFDSGIMIKPFLSCVPEVKIHDFFADKADLTADDVIILGSDGLWDVITNQQAVDRVRNVLEGLPAGNNTRYISAAQSLVSYARGVIRTDRRDVWVLKGTKDYASHDDISCFVIPLSQHISAFQKSDTVSARDSKDSHADCDRVVPARSCAEVGKLPISVKDNASTKDQLLESASDAKDNNDCVDGDNNRTHLKGKCSVDDHLTDKALDTENVIASGECSVTVHESAEPILETLSDAGLVVSGSNSVPDTSVHIQTKRCQTDDVCVPASNTSDMQVTSTDDVDNMLVCSDTKKQDVSKGPPARTDNASDTDVGQHTVPGASSIDNHETNKTSTNHSQNVSRDDKPDMSDYSDAPNVNSCPASTGTHLTSETLTNPSQDVVPNPSDVEQDTDNVCADNSIPTDKLAAGYDDEQNKSTDSEDEFHKCLDIPSDIEKDVENTIIPAADATGDVDSKSADHIDKDSNATSGSEHTHSVLKDSVEKPS